MNEDLDDLELEIKSLPLPHPRKRLDDRVTRSIQRVRDLQRQEVLRPESRQLTPKDSRSRSRLVTQVALTSVLSLVSFGVGRFIDFRSRMHLSGADTLTPPTSAFVVQEKVDSSAEKVFQALVFNHGPTETIWGPAEKLPSRPVVSSQVP